MILSYTNFIKRHNSRIFLLNGTEDQLVVPVDVEKCYNTICENAKEGPGSYEEEESHSDDSRDGHGYGAPTIYTVGKGVGGDKPYSHFDLLFGEDAPKNIFPAILAFLEGHIHGRYSIP